MTEGLFAENINKIFKDPITILLLKNSNLTDLQFETFVIDVLTEVLSEDKISYQEKSFLRNKKVSRGSFSRTLSQSRNNIISSIFTILLIYYIGVFDNLPFEDYELLADQLREYSKLVEETNNNKSEIILETIEKELVQGISELAKPRKLKVM